jgi:hypothetical protein
LSPRVVSASEWMPARKELQATEEEAVRALWQIADDTGRWNKYVKLLYHEKSPEGGHDK